MPRKEVDPDELKELTEVFRRYGAQDPELWARSELAEGIPQRAIFSFAKAMWTVVKDESDDRWIDIEIASSTRRPDDPYSAAGPALSEMLAKGVSREAIVDLVRTFQCETLFHVASLIDGAIDAADADVPVTDWSLVQLDEAGEPIAVIDGLHEVLLEFDPTGREMRPRSYKA